MGIIKQCTHPHSPLLIPTHLHLPKIFTQPPSPTQNNGKLPPLTPTYPKYPNPPKIMSHPPKITHTQSK